MDPTTLEDEETEVVKEMIGGSIPRVDVVRGPASGLRFMVLKAGQPQDPAAIAAIQTKESSVTKSNEAVPAATDPDAPELVIKADGELDLSEVLDPTEVAADPETVHANGDADVPGDVSDPGSPAWEAMDAATARKWTSILSRAKNALGVMGDRELQEVAAGAGDDGDVDAAFDLEDACAAVDYAISILAPFAVDEQSEADTCAEELEGVSKALGPFNPADLDLVEQLSPVVKAGRVLSAGNEAAIRGAVTSLQNVLASLPAAPAAPDPAPVAKTLEVPVDPEKTDLEAVAKAKGDDPAPMIACYDENGHLIGVVAEGDLTAVGAGTPVDPAADTDPAPAPADPDAPVADAPVADPGTQTVQVPVDPDAAPVAKSDDDQEISELVQSAVSKALKERDKGHEEVVKSLTERIDHLESQPMSGGPKLGGAATGGVPMRGQGGESTDSEYLQVKKALDEETDPTQRAVLGRQLTLMNFQAGYGAQR